MPRRRNLPEETEGSVISEAFIVVSRTKGVVKAIHSRPSLNGDEICFKLRVEIPKEVFETRVKTVVAKFNPGDVIPSPDIDCIIEQIEI